MAKKYLLYIHIERFGKEPNKSQLVNELLERYYGPDPSTAADTMPREPKIIKKPEDAMPLVTSIFGDRTKEVCKIHGVPLTDRGKCMQKGCKFGV